MKTKEKRQQKRIKNIFRTLYSKLFVKGIFFFHLLHIVLIFGKTQVLCLCVCVLSISHHIYCSTGFILMSQPYRPAALNNLLNISFAGVTLNIVSIFHHQHETSDRKYLRKMIRNETCNEISVAFSEPTRSKATARTISVCVCLCFD